MRYTLRSRFRGTIAGAFLGLKLTKNASEHINQAYHQVTFTFKSLIKQGKFSIEDFHTGVQTELPESITREKALINTLFSALPIALFFHENMLKLRQNLIEVARVYNDDLIIRDSTLAICYTVAQSLNEKLNPTSVIPEITTFIGETPTNVPQQLQIVEDLLHSDASLEQVYTELYKVNTPSNIVATAFYTFLKSIEDFRLSVLLSFKGASNYDNHDYYLNSVITGALSGAYNSAVSIPVGWQIEYLHSGKETTENNLLRVLLLTDELLAVWSGLYELDNQESKLSTETNLCNYSLPLLEEPRQCVYAAPSVIRLR
ncbi:MAG: ADP-ribosylglycohydrolase family protein [Calothrix sp. C42_A2020_038]|nr:ADP-ribosylglycohydrolase family protein [Calothrix sp. C42_A2020_038]